MQLETPHLIGLAITGVLTSSLGLIAFFLRRLLTGVDKIEKDVERLVTDNAVLSQRVTTLELSHAKLEARLDMIDRRKVGRR